MHAKQECGDHTVEVRTARSIFEEKSRIQNRTTYFSPPPLKKSPSAFQKSDPNKAFKTINDARSNLHHVNVKEKSENPKTSYLSRKQETDSDSERKLSPSESTKQLTKMNSEIIYDEKPKNSSKEDGNKVSSNNESNLCEPEFGNELTKTDIGNAKSQSSKSDVKKCVSTAEISNSRSVEGEKDDTHQNSDLSGNEYKTSESSLISSKSDARTNKCDTKQEGLTHDHEEANNGSGNTNSTEVTNSDKNEVDQETIVDSSENRPDSGYSTAVGENGRNSQENKVDLSEVNETAEKNKLLRGMKAATVDRGEGISKSKNESSKSPEIEQEEDEVETRVVLRKCRSVVSVSNDDKISLVETPEPDCFPNARRSKRSAAPGNFSQSNGGNSDFSIKNKNSVQDFVDSCKSKNNVTSDYNLTISEVKDQDDELDGKVNARPEKEIVENFIDIDDIVRKIDFPNIPSLPNDLPNEKDLKCLNDLKGVLDSDSSDDMSDTGSLSCDDLVQRLNSIVEM